MMLNRLNEIALQQYVFLDLSPGFPSKELFCETPQLSQIGSILSEKIGKFEMKSEISGFFKIFHQSPLG